MSFSVYASDAEVTHTNYMNGNADGYFYPYAAVTRAETAQIFLNLYPDTPIAANIYSDVEEGSWYESAVSALSGAGMLTGYPDGTFHPLQPVSRCEFVKVLVSMTDEEPQGLSPTFSDVPETHWAYNVIAYAEDRGWISSSDGEFHPDEPMRRADAVIVLNAFLGRQPDRKTIDGNPFVRFFPDVRPGDSFYYDVMEATVSHTLRFDKSAEIWTDLTEYEVTLPEGPCYTSEGLYCISDGKVLTDGDYGTGETLHFNADGRYTSGNADIDAYIDRIVAEVITPGMNAVERLRACYDYEYNNVCYLANNNHVPRSSPASEWTETYMLRLIETGKGNCYCYASEMFYLARRVGWDSANVISGGVMGTNDDHGWATVEYGGDTVIVDPELDFGRGPYAGSCFMVKYAEAPFYYYP